MIIEVYPSRQASIENLPIILLSTPMEALI